MVRRPDPAEAMFACVCAAFCCAARPAIAQSCPLCSLTCAIGLHDDAVGLAVCRTDCWVPDYCNAEQFRYKLCKLRLRGRASTKTSEFTCAEGEYCEEVECPDDRCWLPSSCWCETEGKYEGRMMCSDNGCFKHPSTQWGLCRPEPTDDELPPHEHAEEEEPLLPTGFHFWSSDSNLYNNKLHIDEGHPYSRPRAPPLRKDEL